MYVLVFTTLLLLVIIEQSNKRNELKTISVVIAFLLLVMQDGLRWETGTDWNPYYRFFLNPNKDNYLFEIGFIEFAKLSYTISKEYTLFLFLQSLIVNSLILSTLYKFSNYPILSIFIYYCLYTPSMGMSRQFLAIAICIYSIRYLQPLKVLRFISLIIIASLFHKSALIFTLLIFIRREYKIKIYITASIIAIVISLSGVIRLIPSELILLLEGGEEGHLTHYFESGYGQNSTSLFNIIVSILRRSIFIGLGIWKYNYIKNKIRNFHIFFNIYFISYVIYIIFSGSPLQIFVSRLNLYFYFSEALIIPYLLICFKNYSKIIYLLVAIIYCGIFLIKSFNTYNRPGYDNIFIPYKGIFINHEYKRTMW